LCIDSDIIFLGKVLDKFANNSFPFVIHPTYVEDPHTDHYRNQFIDVSKAKEYYPKYKYPGYFFNAGQTVVIPGVLTKELLAPSFDPEYYPYYKNQDFFKTVDQSILNTIFPIIPEPVGVADFVVWSGNYFDAKGNVEFNDYENGETKYLLHYAGDIRTYKLYKMRGEKLLRFFQDTYRAKLSWTGQIVDKLQNVLNSSNALARFFYLKNKLKIKLLKL